MLHLLTALDLTTEYRANFHGNQTCPQLCSHFWFVFSSFSLWFSVIWPQICRRKKLPLISSNHLFQESIGCQLWLSPVCFAGSTFNLTPFFQLIVVLSNSFMLQKFFKPDVNLLNTVVNTELQTY